VPHPEGRAWEGELQKGQRGNTSFGAAVLHQGLSCVLAESKTKHTNATVTTVASSVKDHMKDCVKIWQF